MCEAQSEGVRSDSVRTTQAFDTVTVPDTWVPSLGALIAHLAGNDTMGNASAIS